MWLDKIKETAIAMLWLPIEESEFSPLIVNHPFIESGMIGYQGEMKNILEDETAKKDILMRYQEMLQNAKSLDTIFLLIRKPYRFVFLKFIEGYLDLDEFSQWLGYVWTDSENPSQDVNVSLQEAVKMFQRANKKCLMTDEEFAFFQNLPDEFTVYRGVATGRNPHGLSWTNKLATAVWFSERWDSSGIIRKGRVKKKFVLAYFNRRDENELVISDRNIEDLEEL